MTSDAHTQSLMSALEDFERVLETPVVPGELARWSASAVRAFEKVEPALSVVIEEAHPDDYKEIGRVDPALLAKVDKLRDGDQALKEQFEQLRFLANRLAQRAEELEPEEKRAEHAHQEFIDQGLEFVLEARKQVRAVQTWFQEAHQRDRGPVD